jgi:hypothetical protein
MQQLLKDLADEEERSPGRWHMQDNEAVSDDYYELDLIG